MVVKKELVNRKRSQDEQVLYIDPEENLTSVRERLEQVPIEHIRLVIPPQTLLRSSVTWRLLHRYTQEMGKDVTIVSADQQIRALAQAAQFKAISSIQSGHS